MTDVLTAAQMREIEQDAIASGAVTGLELMERAGRGVVDAVLAEWPEMGERAHRAVLLCGPGNNGGDGFVVARLLKAAGWEVEVFLYGDTAMLPPDAKVNHERWAEMGEVRPLSFPEPARSEVKAFRKAASDVRDLHPRPEREDRPAFLLVDALFGIGLSRPLTGIDDLIRHWNDLTDAPRHTKARIVAIDIPSGLDADSGEVRRDVGRAGTGALRADLTVTFHRCKQAHVAAPLICGKVVVCDIGL